MIYTYTSIKPLIAKIYRDLALESDESWLNMVEWIAEGLEFIGAKPQYAQTIQDIHVKGYRAPLPCGFVALQGVTYCGAAMFKLQGIHDTTSCKDTVDDPHRLRTQHNLGYTINEGYINTNFEHGTITLSFTTASMDEDGLPMIPDDASYREALYRYVLTKLYYPDFLSGKIHPNVYQDMRQQWFNYAQQAAAKANMPDLPTMESIVGEWMQLIPQLGRSNNQFRGLGLPSDSRYNNL